VVLAADLIAVPRDAKVWLDTRTDWSDRAPDFCESNISASLLVFDENLG
jgi:hypothetical protein